MNPRKCFSLLLSQGLSPRINDSSFSLLFVKVPQINYLERRVLQIEKNRADYIIKRRQEDIKDQSADLMSSEEFLSWLTVFLTEGNDFGIILMSGFTVHFFF